MGIQAKIGCFVLAALFIVIVFSFIRKGFIRPSSAIIWIFISAVLISIPLLENFYRWISYNIFGLANTTHLIYMGLIGFCLLYSLYLTTYIAKLSDRLHILICEVGIKNKEIDELKIKIESQTK